MRPRRVSPRKTALSGRYVVLHRRCFNEAEARVASENSVHSSEALHRPSSFNEAEARVASENVLISVTDAGQLTELQ